MKKIKITFSGDIMLDSETIKSYQINEKQFNFNSMFSNIREFLSKSDFNIGNLETPITTDSKEIKYEPYKFTSPIEFAEAVKNAGFDFVTTANNHCLDNGIDGIKKTIDALQKVNIENTGISYKKEKLKLYEINGFKIAILSYTYGTNAFINHIYLEDNENVRVNLFQEQELKNPLIRKLYQNKNKIIRVIRKGLKILRILQFNKMIHERIEPSKEQKKEIINKIQKYKEMGADCIIMCMHEGGQYNKKPIQRAKKTVKFLMKNGIDLIIGNHEHVIQCAKIERKKLISFSLGNFVGAAGVLKEPFDKMAEYSILVNVYISKENQNIHFDKYTFTVLKTIKEKTNKGNTLKVCLLYDVIKKCNDENEKKRLLIDNQKIIQIVTGKQIDINDVQLEYEIK